MLCENFEIPLKQFQMIDLFVDMELEENNVSGHDGASDDEKAKMMLRSPYLDHIDEKHFVSSYHIGLSGMICNHFWNQEYENIKSKNRNLFMMMELPKIFPRLMIILRCFMLRQRKLRYF